MKADPNDASTLGAADRDGDGAEDTADDAPATPSVQLDRDFDLVEDGRDNCLYEGTRADFIDAAAATIGMFYNPRQANADGDSLGKLCDDDDGNYAAGILTRRPRTDAYYPPATDETTGEPLVDEDGAIVLDVNITNVNVTLNWVNPAEVYLPSPPAQVLDLASVRIEWVPADNADNAGEGTLMITQLDVTQPDYFDPRPAAANMYRIGALANGTLYNITIRGFYGDEDVVLATTQIETPASPRAVNFVVVGDAGAGEDSGSARLFWVNPLLDKDTEADPVVDGPQQLASVNITWWELDPLDEGGAAVTLEGAPNAQELLETFSRKSATSSDGTLFIERSGGPSEVTVTLLSYEGATRARQGATIDQLGTALDANNNAPLLEEGNFIAYELMGDLAANSAYLFQLKMSFAGAGAPAPLEPIEFRVWTGANHDVPSLDGFLAEDEFLTADVVNALDPDDDNDGVDDGVDSCRLSVPLGLPAEDRREDTGDFDGDGCKNAEDDDDDGDGVADGADDFPFDGARIGDIDGDDVDDLTDNCRRTYNPGQVNGDGDSFGARCDVNDNEEDFLSAIPAAEQITVMWVNPALPSNAAAPINNITISLTAAGSAVLQETLLVSVADLTAGSFVVGEDALKDNITVAADGSYTLSLTFRYVGSSEIVSLPPGAPLMVEIGPNHDSDVLADGVDDDVDNDGVVNDRDPDDASTLGAADADGDGVEDTVDHAPNNAAVHIDTDSDLVDDNSDNCRYGGTREEFNAAGDETKAMFSNPDQANADGDSLGDLCDEDDGNYAPAILTRRPSAVAYFVGDSDTINVNVSLQWNNPAELYLPSPPARALDLTSVLISWVPADNSLAGGESTLPAADFNPGPGAANEYRIEGLNGATLYNITIRGRYGDEDVVLAMTRIETPAAPQAVNFIVVGDVVPGASSASARLFWTNPLLDKDTTVDPLVNGPQQIDRVNITWWKLDPLAVALDANAQELLGTFARESTSSAGTILIERSGGTISVTETPGSYDGEASVRQGATSSQLGEALGGSNELLLEEGNFIAYELLAGLAADSPYLFQLSMSFTGEPEPAPLEPVEFRMWTGANYDVPSLDGFIDEDEFSAPDLVDLLDPDDDNDGFADTADTCQFTAAAGIGVVLNNVRTLDVDQDGCHDALDLDIDLPAVTNLRAVSTTPNEVALGWDNPTAADYISGFNIAWTDAAGQLQNQLLSRPASQPAQTSYSVAGLVGGSSASGDTESIVTYADFKVTALYESEGNSSAIDVAASPVNVAAAPMDSADLTAVVNAITSPAAETLEVTIPRSSLPANPGTTLAEGAEVQFSTRSDQTLATLTAADGTSPFTGQVDSLVGAQQHSMAIFASYDIAGAPPQRTLRIPIASFTPDDASRSTVPLPLPLRDFAAVGGVDQVVISWLNPDPNPLKDNYLGVDLSIDGTPLSTGRLVGVNEYTDPFPPSAPGTTAAPRSYAANAVYALWDEQGNPIGGVEQPQETPSTDSAGPITSSGVENLAADGGTNQIELSWDNPAPTEAGVEILRTEVGYHYVPAGGVPIDATFANLSEASSLSRTKGQSVTLTVDSLIGGYDYEFRVTPFVSTSSGEASLQTAEVRGRADFPVAAVPTLTATSQVATVIFTHTVPDNAPPLRAGDTTPANDATNYVVEMSTAGYQFAMSPTSRQFLVEREVDLNAAGLTLTPANTGNNLTSGVPWRAAVRYSYSVGGSSDSSAESDAAIPRLPVPDMITLRSVLNEANVLTGGFRFDLTTVDPSIAVDVQVEINATQADTDAGASNDNKPTVSGTYTTGMISTGVTFVSNSLTGGLEYKAYLTPKYTVAGRLLPPHPHDSEEVIVESPPAVPRLPTIENVVATPVRDGYPLGKVALMWDSPSDIPGTANDLVGYSLAIINATNPAAIYTEDISLDRGSLDPDSNSFVLDDGYIVDYSRLEFDRVSASRDAVFPGDELTFRVTPRYNQTGPLASALAVNGEPSAEASATPYAALIRAITPDYSSGMVNIDISTVFKYGEISHFNITYSSTDLGVPPTTFIPLSGIPNPADNADNFTLQVAMTRIFPDAVTPSARFQFDAEVVHTGRNMQAFRAGRATGLAEEILINRDIDGDGLLGGIVDSPATPLDQCPAEQGNSVDLDFDLDGCRDTADETLAISGPTNPMLAVPADEAAGRTSLDLSWTAADTTQDYYTSFTHYEISIRRHDGGDSTFLPSQNVMGRTTTTATLSDLVPDRTYSVAVRAVFRNMGGVQVFSRRSDYSTPVMTLPFLAADSVDDDRDGLIEIRTAEQLNNIRYDLDGSSYKESATAAANTTGCPSSGCNGYELEDDISLAAYASGTGWVPIGNLTEGFSGIFEGNEYIIRNLTIALPTMDLVGFFASLTGGAQVRNVQFADVDVRGRLSVGGLAGRAYGTSSAAVTIVNTSVEGSVAGSENNLGGLVGLAGADGSLGTVIESSFFKGRIIATGDAENVGGLVGNDGFPLISAPRAQRIKISASFARANITSSSTAAFIYMGGLIGQMRGGVIENSYMSGSIMGDQRNRNIGGIAGRPAASSITNSYVVAPIGPLNNLHVVGIGVFPNTVNQHPTITNSYYASVPGAPGFGAGGGTGRMTPAEMQVIRTSTNLYSTWTATCPNDSTKRIWSFAANRYPLIQCTLGGIDAQN